MNLLGLRTCVYTVPNLEDAKNWYANILGFPPYFDEPFYVGFNVAGFELGLTPDENESKEKSTNISTYWGVENVDAAYQKLIESGATTFEQPTDVGSGIIVAAVKDPWNNVFGIIFNPYFVQ